MNISIEILAVLASAFGISAVLPLVVTYFLKQREKEAEKEDKVEEAQVEDAGKLREELWRELKNANERNDALSTRYGAVLQDKAALAGQLEAANKQIQDMIQRLTAEGLRVNDAEDRAKRDRTARDQAESRYEFLVERHKELERDYARIARGNATRKSDLEPTGEEPGKILATRRENDRKGQT